MTWANLLMLLQSIPEYDYGKKEVAESVTQVEGLDELAGLMGL
jgi:hypothetical protein